MGRGRVGRIVARRSTGIRRVRADGEGCEAGRGTT